jgi:hypothetical protein
LEWIYRPASTDLLVLTDLHASIDQRQSTDRLWKSRLRRKPKII